MLRVGEVVKVEVNYPKNPTLSGVYVGKVTKIGCFRSGFAFFMLDSVKKALPNSSRYTKILERIQ